MGTVITLGDKVIEHDKEIGELEEGLEKIEERVDDVEEDQEEAKIKIEEIDNKVIESWFPCNPSVGTLFIYLNEQLV